MGTYQIKQARLVWRYSDTDIVQNAAMPTPNSSFPLSDLRSHGETHDGNLCDASGASAHDPLDPSDHSFDLPTPEDERRGALRAAWEQLFAIFSPRGNFELDLNAYAHSTTGGSGDHWAPTSTAVAYRLLEGQNAIEQQKDNKTYSLWIEASADVAV